MIARVSDNQTIQARNGTNTEVKSDPVALGEYNLARGVLVVHQIQAAGANTAKLSVYPEYSNDGVYWKADTTTVVTADTPTGTGTFLSNEFQPEWAYVRFKFVVNPAETGTDDGIAFVTFDWVVRFSNQ